MAATGRSLSGSHEGSLTWGWGPCADPQAHRVACWVKHWFKEDPEERTWTKSPKEWERAFPYPPPFPPPLSPAVPRVPATLPTASVPAPLPAEQCVPPARSATIDLTATVAANVPVACGPQIVRHGARLRSLPGGPPEIDRPSAGCVFAPVCEGTPERSGWIHTSKRGIVDPGKHIAQRNDVRRLSLSFLTSSSLAAAAVLCVDAGVYMRLDRLV